MPGHHAIFEKFRRWEGPVPPGNSVNFVGIRTQVKYYSSGTDAPAEHFAKPPLPAFNEEYFEWIDLLEAVQAAETHFTMVELGAGWGRWLTNAVGAIGASRPRSYTLVGVEAEPTHFGWLREHLAANGVDLAHCRLHEAAVAARDGHVWFHGGRPTEWYGQAAIPYFRRLLLELRGHIPDGEFVRKVKAVSLQSLLASLDVVDLVDMDIQGAEADVLESAGPALAKVRRVHVGTHGAEIEERLRVLFGRLGWRKTNDYPCGRTVDTPYGPIAFQDGVQTWINPSPALPQSR